MSRVWTDRAGTSEARASGGGAGRAAARGVLLAALVLGAAGPAAQAEAQRRTERAYVGVFLKTVRHLYTNEGTFDADLLLWVRWRSAGGLDASGVSLDNALDVEREELAREDRDGWTRVLWRVTGSFHGRFELSRYPFDRQELTLSVVHPTIGADELRLEPDVESSGVAPELDIPGWIFERKFSVYRSLSATLPGAARAGQDAEDEPAGASQVHFRVYLTRPQVPLLTKILLPLLLVLAMGHATFWIDPEDTSSRLMLVSMAVFAEVCVHFTLGAMVPDAAQLLIVDYYVFFVYALLLGYVVCATATHVLLQRGRPLAVAQVDRAVRWGFPVLLAVGVIWVTVPREPPPEPPPPRPASARPELTVGTLQEPRNLGPGADGGIERFFTGLFLRPLASLDDRWELQPELVEEVPSFANGLWELRPDGSSAVRWVLRPGARWGDGEPMVPEDFVATHALLRYRGASKVVPTEDGAIVEYRQPRPDAVYEVPLLPAHRLEALPLYERLEELRKALPPLSGPFLLQDWTRGRELVLVRNPHYAGGPAALERIRVRFFDTKDELLAALRAGEIGLVPPGDLGADEARELVREQPALVARIADSTVVWHLEVNLDDPVLADARVRQALLLGTDREAMIRELTRGAGEVAHSWLPVEHEGYDPGIRRYPYDPARAAALLEAAGYLPGPDGLRRSADGRELRLQIAALASRRPEAEWLQAAWRPLGVEVRFHEVPHEQFLGEYTARRLFPQLAFYGFVAAPHETGRKRWDQERIPSASNGWSGENLTGWRNAEVSELHRRLEVTFNTEERVELLARQQASWAEELPILPLYTGKSVLVHHVRLRNVRPHPSERAALSWNAEAWTYEP